MAKEKFERNKPHCNVGTIGHVDHGNVDGDYEFGEAAGLTSRITLISTRLRRSRRYYGATAC